MAVLKYHAYIDEAGDEGLGKIRQHGVSGGQSKWFALGAFLVPEIHDRSLPVWRDEITGLFPQRAARDLHFRNLKHEQKIAACFNLAEKPFGACVILSCKETIVSSPKYEIFKQPQHLYNYLVRFALERITRTCSRHAASSGDTASLMVTFSRRQGTDYQKMAEYLTLMKEGREVMPSIGAINWAVFDPQNIRVENHEKRAGLQLADVVTSATFTALEPGIYGHCEEGYARVLKGRYIGHNGSILNCGVTLIPPVHKSPMPDAQKAFIRNLAQK